VIDHLFPLREAAAAHAWLEAGEHVGKVMLEV
jgi:NADPH:quinone reductase-like Zn-dependent oxidoreductase